MGAGSNGSADICVQVLNVLIKVLCLGKASWPNEQKILVSAFLAIISLNQNIELTGLLTY